MKKTLLLIGCMAFFSALFSQKHNLYFDIGSKVTNTSLKNNEPFQCIDSPCPITLERTQEQTPFKMASFSIGYAYKISSKFELSIAFNANLKGFTEKITSESNGQVVEGSTLLYDDYYGLLFSTQYQFLQKRFGNIFIQAQINPEMTQITEYLPFTLKTKETFPIYWNTRFGFGSNINLSKKWQIFINPFFEIALGKYEIQFPSGFYKFYGFGNNIGLKRHF